MPKPHPQEAMHNSTPGLTADCVETMKRYQDLGRDIEMLRDHLRSPTPRTGLMVRIVAVLLSASTLTQTATRMLITALSEESSVSQ